MRMCAMHTHKCTQGQTAETDTQQIPKSKHLFVSEYKALCIRVHIFFLDGGRTCMLCESGSVCVVERRRPRLMRGMAAAGAAGSVVHWS